MAARWEIQKITQGRFRRILGFAVLQCCSGSCTLFCLRHFVPVYDETKLSPLLEFPVRTESRLPMTPLLLLSLWTGFYKCDNFVTKRNDYFKERRTLVTASFSCSNNAEDTIDQSCRHDVTLAITVT